MISPYKDVPESQWLSVTEGLISIHPLKDKIVSVVLESWEEIFQSKIGAYSIGREIFPSPQIMSFFLHELVAHNLSLFYPREYKVGVLKNEKDIHCITNPDMGIEIKASSNHTQIFANRSYAQPSSDSETKDKNGYYLAINFDKVTMDNPHPKILRIRFGYLEHSDWIPQRASTGQQARLSKLAYETKLITLYEK